MKKVLVSLVLATALLVCCTLPAVAAGSALTVQVRIEGKEGNLFYGNITTNNSSNYTIANVLRLAEVKSGDLHIEGLEYGYITAVNGVRLGQSNSGKDAYTILVNDTRVPFEEINTYQLKSGDSIVVYYADNYGADTIIPIIDTDRLDVGYIRFCYEKVSDDGKTLTNLPLIGAEVTWYCDDAPFTYTTDGQGGIYLDKNAITSGSHKLNVELRNEDGVPLLLRPAPDFTIDVAVSIGDSFAVYFCAAAVLFSLALSISLVISLKKSAYKKDC